MPDASPTPIDRRVWRLGFLLTGSADAASSLITSIHRSRRDAASLEPAILDRMIIQHARSLPRAEARFLPASTDSTPASLSAASDALTAALHLSRQPQEAWVLKRLDDLDDLHIARAMDCSKSAARLHLSAADESMALRLADRLPTTIAALRRYADSLDPAPHIEAFHHRQRLSRARRFKLILLFSTAALLLIAFIILKLMVDGAL